MVTLLRRSGRSEHFIVLKTRSRATSPFATTSVGLGIPYDLGKRGCGGVNAKGLDCATITSVGLLLMNGDIVSILFLPGRLRLDVDCALLS